MKVSFSLEISIKGLIQIKDFYNNYLERNGLKKKFSPIEF